MSKRIVNNILLGLIVLLAATGLTGCVYDSFPDEPLPDDRDVYLTLNIGTSDSFGTSTQTRAGSYFYEEPERQNEMLNNVTVYVLREDGTIEDSRRMNISSGVNSTSMTFKVSEGKKKVFLFGNDTALPAAFKNLLGSLARNDVFPQTVLSNMVLTREQSKQFYTTEQDIPMCESFDFDLDVTNAGTIYFNADVFVTRIAVKYTFICRDNVDTLTIRLNKMGCSQYFMPRNVTYNPGKYQAPEIINGIPGRNIKEFFTPGQTTQASFEMTLSGKTEIELTDEEGKTSKAYRYDPVYMMETSGTSFSMSIRFDQGIEGVQPGDWYADQILPNLPLLPRNTHVVVYLGADNNILNCKVDVVPYRGCVLEPYFGLERN